MLLKSDQNISKDLKNQIYFYGKKIKSFFLETLYDNVDFDHYIQLSYWKKKWKECKIIGDANALCLTQ